MYSVQEKENATDLPTGSTKLRLFFNSMTLEDFSNDCNAVATRQQMVRNYCTPFGDPSKTREGVALAYIASGKVFTHHKMPIISVQWEPTASGRFAVSCADSNASVWLPAQRTASETQRGMFVMLWHNYAIDGAYPSHHELTDLQWHPSNSSELITATASDTNIRTWSIEQFGSQIRAIVSNHCGVITAASPNGSHIATGSLDGTCVVWNSTTSELVRRNSLHTEAIMDIQWMNNKMFASCSADKKIIIWNFEIRMPVQIFIGHTEAVTCIDVSCTFDTDDEICGWLASASVDGTVCVWARQSRLCIHKYTVSTDVDQSRYPVLWLSWSKSQMFPDQANILAALTDQSIMYLWNGVTGDYIQRVQLDGGPSSACFSPDGFFIMLGCSNGSIMIMDTLGSQATHTRRNFWISRTIECPNGLNNDIDMSESNVFMESDGSTYDPITDVSWSHNGAQIVAGCHSGTIYLIEFARKAAK